jgi:glycosyltransferase involved in cell wall biosynthesis
MSERPRISIVIPVYNCSRTIAKCVDSLARMDHSDFEIIVVDDCSTDGTAEICESYDNVRVIRMAKGGPSRARNIGVAECRGEFVAFTDGDCVVERNWLTELAKGFDGPLVAGVGGDQRSPHDDTEFGKLVQDFLKTIGFMTGYIKPHSKLKETDHNPSCNAIYRKTVFQEVGGFDEWLWPGEDVELDRKIVDRGYKLIYNPDAVVFHYRPASLAGFCSMMRRYGASQWPLVRRYGFFRKLHYEPPALALGIVAVAAALYWEQRLWPMVFLPFVFCFSWFSAKTLSLKKSLKFMMLLLTTLVCWNWGFFTAWSRTKPNNPLSKNLE